MGARRQTLKLSLFVFLHFTPFTSYLTILTQIYHEAGLDQIAPVSLGFIYFFFIVSTILAPAVKWSLKSQLLFGGCCYTLTYISGILASLTSVTALKFTITCIGSTMTGFSAGFLWVSQGRYVHLVCEKYGALDKKGEMFGLINSAYCMSNVSAGLIITFGLGFFDARTYFFITTFLGLLATAYCLFFVKNIKEENGPLAVHEQSQSLISQTNHQKQQPNSLTEPKQEPYDMWKLIKQTIMFTPKMYPVLLVMILDGYSTSVYSSQIPKLIPQDIDPDLVDKLAGITIITLGIGSVIGSLSCGKVADIWGSLLAGRLNLILWVVACFCFIAAQKWPHLALAQVAAFLWGFSLSYMEGWLYTVCSRSYEGAAGAFSVNKQFHSWFYLFVQIAVLATDNELPLFWLNTFMALAAIPSWVLINRVPKIRQS